MIGKKSILSYEQLTSILRSLKTKKSGFKDFLSVCLLLVHEPKAKTSDQYGSNWHKTAFWARIDVQEAIFKINAHFQVQF